jgi:hypothetical protein
MKSTVGVYEIQSDALAAVNALKAAGYSNKHVSLVGRTTASDSEMSSEETKDMNISATGLGIGAVAGSALGILTGLGLLAIPGLGILYGAGALAGAIAGLDAGLIGGGIVSALTIAGTDNDAKYHEHLSAGRYLVVVQGTAEEVTQAHKVLDQLGTHHELSSHS